MTIQTDLYDSMLDDIYTLTNRPDLSAETALALRAATTNAHLTDVYPRDCITDQVQLPNSAGFFAVNLSTAFPMIRGVDKILPLDVNLQVIAQSEHNHIEIVELGDIYDPEYGNLRTNIAYLSGDSLVIRYPMNVQGFAISWIRAPQTARSLYNSWIAQMYPAIIWYWAAALVLSTNGNEDKARNYLDQVQKLYIPQLKSNFLTGAIR